MAHMNVNKIRFYPSHGLYSVLENGIDEYTKITTHRATDDSLIRTLEDAEVTSILGMSPSAPKRIELNSAEDYIKCVLPTGAITENAANYNLNFIGLLGHNFKDISAYIPTVYAYDPVSGVSEELILTADILNASVTQGLWWLPTSSQVGNVMDIDGQDIEYGNQSNGTSIVSMSSSISSNVAKYIMFEVREYGGGWDSLAGKTIELGSIIYGRYYDMPHSPDLSYSMNVQHDGVNTVRTVGGSDMTNINYSRKPGFCGKYRPFSSGMLQNMAAITGRRSWNFQFSSLKSGFDLTASEDGSPDGSFSQDTGFLFPHDHLSTEQYAQSNDFYFRVLQKTYGGMLPMIFEFDNSEVPYDGNYGNFPSWPQGEHYEEHFVLAKFKNKGFKFSHSSFKFFDVSMQIEETW